MNEAIFGALQDGVVCSTTLMVPCPWMLHAMHFLADHPEIPFGVHLTVISELDHLELEFRTQIEVVLGAGLQPTHLDWHCLRFGGRKDIFDLMWRLAMEYGLALRVMGGSSIEKCKAWVCQQVIMTFWVAISLARLIKLLVMLSYYTSYPLV